MKGVVVTTAVSVIALACPGDKGSGSSINLSWTGSDTGRLEVPASAQWCREDSVLIIRGEQSDSAVALAFFPRDSVISGNFTIDGVGTPLPRPHGRVALRWLGENLIVGYYSVSGSGSVGTGSPLAGRVESTLKSAVDGTQLKVTAAFTGIVVSPALPGCGSGIPADSSVR